MNLKVFGARLRAAREQKGVSLFTACQEVCEGRGFAFNTERVRRAHSRAVFRAGLIAQTFFQLAEAPTVLIVVTRTGIHAQPLRFGSLKVHPPATQ